MVAIVFVSPPTVTPTPPLYSQWTSMVHTWTGYNGDSWMISDRASGVYLRAGTRGMGTPDYTDFYDEGSLDGGVYQDSIATMREVFWPITVWRNTTAEDWRDFDRRLWKTLRRRYPGVWTVTDPDTGSARSLRLRIKDDGQFAPDTQPDLIGWAQYGLTFTAEQPFWEGQTVTRVFGQPESPKNFFGGGDPTVAGYGPPFHVGPGLSINNASITNDGDVDAAQKWAIIGPSTSAVVGIGDQFITVPTTVPAGTWVQIDAIKQTALWGTAFIGSDGLPAVYSDSDAIPDFTQGARRTPDGLGAVGFPRLPPGQNVALNISLTGNGYVRLDMTPLYERAW